ncbi:hypothetical protein [Hymenobacter cheonanensis]|uniref:hypothetical protein n=1 Tax=Hymenobacter sp. CA2-7 TaxID=3063993 RepID=UPI002713C4B5|nr:hypothetical protein [Hymenobacter sp. CA2-7]MDO7887550.1 hypothetical protein [Hymenobacter sp. CA2-7]
MKALRLPLVSVLGGLLLLAGSCKKTDELAANAIITGYDPRMCACCGGLMITFTGKPQPFAGEFKLIDNSAGLGISSTEKFPLYVQVDYITLANTCGGQHIKITSLKR